MFSLWAPVIRITAAHHRKWYKYRAGVSCRPDYSLYPFRYRLNVSSPIYNTPQTGYTYVTMVTYITSR